MSAVRVDRVESPDADTVAYCLADLAAAVPVPLILDDNDAAADAWQALAEAIADELQPKVLELLEDAYKRRLPWRYPPA